MIPAQHAQGQQQQRQRSRLWHGATATTTGSVIQRGHAQRTHTGREVQEGREQGREVGISRVQRQIRNATDDEVCHPGQTKIV